MIKAIIPSLLFVASLAGPASAGFFTGNDLQRLCSQKDHIVVGFSVGVAEILDDANPKEVCLPNGATVRQVTDIVCQFVDKNPKDRHETAHFLAYLALFEAFPCKK